MEQFASDNRNKIRVIGIGGTDSLGQAKDFYNRFNPSNMIMYFDDSSPLVATTEFGAFTLGTQAWMVLNEVGEVISEKVSKFISGGRFNNNTVLNLIS